MYKDQPIIAVKGLVGWHVQGRSSPSCAYHAGPYQDTPKGCKYLVDMVSVYEQGDLANAVNMIWKRPNLNLGLPDNNVRNLFEGCIGCGEGTTDGHAWDNSLHSLKSTDSVGVEIYLKILLAAGGKLVTTP
jgi:hypothetical protein